MVHGFSTPCSVSLAFSSSAKNKIYEIAEEGTFAPGYSPDGVEKFIVGDDRSKWFKQ